MVFLKKNLLMMLLMVVGSFVFLGVPGSAYAVAKVAYSCEGADPAPDVQVCVSNPDGSDTVQVTNFNPQWTQPIGSIAWTGNYTQLLFTRWTQTQDAFPGTDGEGLYLFRVDVDGSNLQVVNLESPLYNANLSLMAPLAATENAPVNVASVSTFGQFLIVFMLGGISALWMTRRNSRMVSVNPTR